MFQRKQSLFLTLAIVATALIPFTAWADRVMADSSRLVLWTAAVLGAAAIVLDAISLFLYGNRTVQLRIVRAANYMQTGLLAAETAVLLTLGGIGLYLLDESIAFLLTCAALVFQLLAVRAIRADIRLVESSDRIR